MNCLRTLAQRQFASNQFYSGPLGEYNTVQISEGSSPAFSRPRMGAEELEHFLTEESKTSTLRLVPIYRLPDRKLEIEELTFRRLFNRIGTDISFLSLISNETQGYYHHSGSPDVHMCLVGVTSYQVLWTTVRRRTIVQTRGLILLKTDGAV